MQEIFSSQKCPDWTRHEVHQSLFLVPSFVICDIIPPYPHIPEEQLYLALNIAVMKFQMEINKLLIVNMFIRYVPPKDSGYPACDKGCSQCPAVMLLRLCNIFH
jgi:hypothetical protein